MTRDFFKDGFTADQFRNCVTLVEGDAPQRLADRANAILKAEMEKAVEVFGSGGAFWIRPRVKGHTHSAKLVRVELVK